jgi:tRNA-Thr(GGU) m(6)t(6)A37 methyltransferase TsaA
MNFTISPIGIIHTPFTEKASTPIQAARSQAAGVVEVYGTFIDGLEGIEAFSHIYLLYRFHESGDDVALRVQPFLDDRRHGLFATRYPVRPNAIGVSVVRLTHRVNNLLYFNGADMLNGTPLLDIKPYIPEFDVFSVDQIGWYQQRSNQ